MSHYHLKHETLKNMDLRTRKTLLHYMENAPTAGFGLGVPAAFYQLVLS